MARRYLSLACAAAVFSWGCGDDAGSAGDGAEAPSSSSGGSEAPTTGEDPATSAADEAGEDGDESSGGGAPVGDLPGYDDSECWGQVAQTDVYNLDKHITESTAATCRGEGMRARVFVADTLWDAGVVDQSEVDGFINRLELVTPEGSHDPGQGVLVNNEEIFGDFPQGTVDIFIVDSKGAGDGYLCGWCSTPVIHIDGVVIDAIGGERAASVAAHESYHLIHRAIDGDEAQWVDETVAQAAMTANGFFTDGDWLADFLSDPGDLWGPGADAGFGTFNYGAGLLFGTMLWERGGAELMWAITHESADEWEGLDAALSSVGSDKTAWEHFLDMAVAIYIDMPESGYGFAAFGVEGVATEGELTATSMGEGRVDPFAFDYWPLTTSGAVGLSMNGDPGLAAQAVVVDGEDVQVLPVGSGTQLDIPDSASAAFVVVTANAQANYTLIVD
ncbi:MAG: hypothetical protein AAGA54_06880 [Myxococcota bacterium]